ncbi:MAG TPA: alkaline phosphatase family protein [Trebonia sp.]
MMKIWQWLLAATVFVLVLAGCTGPGSETETSGGAATGASPAASGIHRGLSAARHVWVIDMENQGYQQSFGTPSADPYLARTLPRMGALLENYYAIGHSSAANYIAQVSGQAPALGTQSDCPVWVPFPGDAVAGPYHQVLGEGCIYRPAVQTVGNQMSAAGFSWAAYLQDMGNDPARDNTVSTARGPACGHPATGAVDHTHRAERADQYAARHDGFAFFRSVTGNRAFCAAHILSFRPLPGDLARARTTPAFSFIVPNLCDDGHDAPCVTGAPGGLAQADTFLSRWVPKIMAAPAYRDGGLIVVTFDEGSDAAACCGETSGLSHGHPNVPEPGKNGPGGGRVGAVLLSPLIRPGTVSTVEYNHYSLLRTVEDIFGLPHLGDAAMPQVRSFGPDVSG